MIQIKNWSKYQSYKDRKPPWIRFHTSMLDNYEFQMMAAESRALLPMLWLLACEYEDPKAGIIDMELKVLAFRLRLDEKIIKKSLDELESSGFIDCNKIVTDSLRDSNQAVSTETETETETDKPKAKRFVPPTHDDVFSYMKERGCNSYQEAEKFIDFYQSKGWLVGKSKMKDWKAAVRNWLKNYTPDPRDQQPIETDRSRKLKEKYQVPSDLLENDHVSERI